MITAGKLIQEDKIRTRELDKVKVTCSCGHRVIIPVWANKTLCSWCGHYVYRNKQEEFKEKMAQKLKKCGTI